MKQLLVILLVLELCSVMMLSASENPSRVLLQVRVSPFEGNAKLLCRIHNPDMHTAVSIVKAPNNSHNGFTVYRLDKHGHSRRAGVFMGESFRIGEEFMPSIVVVQPSSIRDDLVELGMFIDERTARSLLTGGYSLWQWQIIPWQSTVKGKAV